MVSQPRWGLFGRSQTPLSAGRALSVHLRGIIDDWGNRAIERPDGSHPEAAMLSVPTLWVVFMVNFMALGLIWTYVARSYPKFEAARFWTAAAFVAALGAAISMFRGIVSMPLVPLLVGGTLMVLAVSCASMGIKRFYDRPASWVQTALVTAGTCAGLAFFIAVYDSMPMRILIYSIGLSIPFAATLPLVLNPEVSRGNPGARLAGSIAVLIIAVDVIRSVAAFVGVGGDLTMVKFNAFQASMILLLVFLSMAWNFGFLLMAIERLRGEVADLAMSDDLTGAGNRRHLLQRLTEECAVSERSGEVFSILAIDLDSFKSINDSFGHGAGDECLRLLSNAVQSRLRPNDLLTRSGGDEFCVVLPATTLREGAMMARRVLEACRKQLTPEQGAPVAIAASIGVAQWTPQIGRHPERLIAAADQALYMAKNDGKDRYAVYQQPEPALPERIELRRTA